MILSPEIVHQIKGHKRTMFRLPRRTQRCMYQPGRAYMLKTSQWGRQACQITVEKVEQAIFEDRPVWVIRFKLGNHTDEDRYPAARPGGAGGDYTSIPSRKLSGCGAEVSAHELSRYVAMRDEKEPDRLAEQKQRLDAALTEIRKHGRNPFVNKQLREAHERINTIRVPRGSLATGASDQQGGDARSAQSGAHP